MANRQLENDLTPTGWPVRKGWISSRFGERNDPFTGEREQHSGLDFAGYTGNRGVECRERGCHLGGQP